MQYLYVAVVVLSLASFSECITTDEPVTYTFTGDIKIDNLLKQSEPGLHPHPKRFTRIRQLDPIPHSIQLLKTETDINKHIHYNVVNATELDLLVMIESTPSSKQWRQAIRETWGVTDLARQTAVVFVIPFSDHNINNTIDLMKEMILYQDIILFNQISTFTMNSVKLVHYLFWCSTLYDYTHLLRSNDRYFIRVDNIVNTLAPYNCNDLLYSGYFKGNISVSIEDLLWLVCPTYTPHADEGAYLLSRLLVNRFIKHFYYLSYFYSEGGSVGLWTSPFKRVKLIHRIDFDSNNSRGCVNSLSTRKENSFEDMRTRYHRLNNGGQFCKEEFTTEKSYNYNWSNLPSQCCDRE